MHLSKRKQILQDTVYKNLHGGKVTGVNLNFNRAGNSQNEQQDAVINSIFKYCCTKYISCSFLNAHLYSKGSINGSNRESSPANYFQSYPILQILRALLRVYA